MDNLKLLIQQNYKNYEGKWPTRTQEEFTKEYYNSVLTKADILDEIKLKEEKIVNKTVEKVYQKFIKYKEADPDGKLASRDILYLFRQCSLAIIRENQESLKDKIREVFDLFKELGFESNFLSETFSTLKTISRDELSYNAYYNIEPYLNLLSMEKLDLFDSIESKIDYIAKETSEKIYKKYPDMLIRDPEMIYSIRDLSLLLKQVSLSSLTDNIELIKEQINMSFSLFKELKMSEELILDTMAYLKVITKKELAPSEFMLIEKSLNIIQYERFNNYQNIISYRENIKEKILNSFLKMDLLPQNLINHIIEKISICAISDNYHNLKNYILNMNLFLEKNNFDDKEINELYSHIRSSFKEYLEQKDFNLIEPLLKMLELQRIKLVENIQERREKIIRLTNDRVYIKYPKILKADTKKLGLRDLNIIFNECIVFMMSGREDLLKEKVDYFSQLFSKLSFEPGFLSDTYQILDETALRELAPSTYTVIQPYLKIVKENISSELKTIIPIKGSL